MKGYRNGCSTDECGIEQDESVEASSGASLVEYTILVLFIAVVCLAAINSLGSELSQRFESIASNVDAV